MTDLTVTSKGQVTLRKEVLRHLGVSPGDRITVDMLPGRRIEVTATAPAGRIGDLSGMLKHETKVRLTLEEIEQAVADGWAGKV